MITPKQRIQAIEDGLTLDGDYQYELEALAALTAELPVYRHLGTPVWQIQDAQADIDRIINWINEELAHGEEE